MKIVARLTDVPFTPMRAFIINCGTIWVTSLALASVLAHTDCPVLVIDCESKDASAAHFERLARACGLDFHWLSWPLRPHPAALDALFRSVPSDLVLLVDSDVELLSRRVFAGMTSQIAADTSAYGAGFLHGPAWMGQEHGLPAAPAITRNACGFPSCCCERHPSVACFARDAVSPTDDRFSRFPGGRGSRAGSAIDTGSVACATCAFRDGDVAAARNGSRSTGNTRPSSSTTPARICISGCSRKVIRSRGCPRCYGATSVITTV